VLPNKVNFESMGKNGRMYYEKHYTKEKCLSHLKELIS
jgi:hypothetical protein